MEDEPDSSDEISVWPESKDSDLSSDDDKNSEDDEDSMRSFIDEKDAPLEPSSTS